MPAYSRDTGWTQTIFRKRQDAAWSGDDALGFVRDGGVWVQFQAPVGDEDLLRPENLVATPSDLSAAFTWTNPTPLSAAATPTHVQYRSATTTAVWTEEEYPITGTTFAFLAPETEYQFQVRYIIREDGSTTATGAITEVFFTTLALTGPGTPAEDPGGTGPDTTVPWGNTDDPGPVGGPGTWWEYIVQTATTPASGAITWSDSAVTGSFDGDAGSLEIDFVAAGLTCGALARFKYRQNDDGVPGTYMFGEPFVMACDWDVACAGIAASTQLNTGLYADVNCLLAFPELCGTTIRDTINTTIELGRLPGFGSIQTFDGPHTVYGLTTNGTLGKPTLGGQFGTLALLEDGDDFSASIQVQLEEVPGGSGGGGGVAPASFPLVRFGRNVAISAVFSTTTTFLFRASWIDATGAFQSITTATAYDLDEYHQVALTMDANGTKTLYVNGAADGTNTDTTAMAFSDAGIGQDIEVYTNEFGRFRAVAAWDRLLSAGEVATLVSWGAPTAIGTEWALSVYSAPNNTLTLAVPAVGSLESGDVAVVCADITNSNLYSGTGWTDVGEVATDRQVLYRVLNGTETGNFPDLSRVDGNVQDAVVTVFRGLDTADPVDAGGTLTSANQFVEDDGVLDEFNDPTVNGGVQWGVCMTTSGTNVPEGYGYKQSGWDFVAPPTNRQIQLYRTRIFPLTTDTPWTVTDGNNWYINNILGTGAFVRVFRPITLNPATAYSGSSAASISFVDSATATGTDDTISVSIPGGAAAGDFVVFVGTTAAGLAQADDVDQSFLQDHRIQDNSNPRGSFFAGAILPEGEAVPASITLTSSNGADPWRGSVLVYRGVDPVCPIDFYGSTSTRDVSTAGASQPPHTTKFDGSLVLSLAAATRTFSSGLALGAITNANGYTQRVAATGASGSNIVDSFCYEKLKSTAGAVDLMTIGSGGSQQAWVTMCLRGKNTAPA